MKVNAEDFATIKAALLDTLTAHNLHPFMVKSPRQAWEVFHKACSTERLDCTELYKTYNDANIETVLKKVFSNL